MKFIFLTLFISISLFSFSQDTIQLFQEKKKVKKDAVQEIQALPDNTKGRIKYIKYGTSTGSCTGYCYSEATVDSAKTVKIKQSLPPDNKYPAKTDSTETQSAQWDMLIASVQINSFFEIPKKIGNPGANAGVFEWIEINYSGRKHKVVFDNTGPEEYEGIKNLRLLLRRITGV
ncbi:MAG: hypothetical protein EPN85_03845 [Bacteroidetes bacterium]|nr:MAG: hypothetical protein EPN85_03845 [Bacteroidota bacterium]